ncbi:terpene synthase family protein [Kitasatospora sp. NPDC058162]|uniref:terpene synthase family protein n=1 Tax=Kitasatospora sp. NPDC058162 TaxID=3346362 RepID=UPI0036DCD154
MTTVRRTLGVPPFFCPLPDAVYDKPEEIDAGAVAWMFRQGFRKEGDWLPRMNAGSYTAHCMPHVLDRCAEIITYVMYWGGAWDDDLDVIPGLDQPAPLTVHVSRLKHILASPKSVVPPGDAYLSSFQDFWNHIATVSTPGQLEHLRQGFCSYFDGVLWKCANQSLGELPELGDYLIMRGNDVAGPWLTALTPIGGGYELTAAERLDPRVRAASEAVSVIVGLDNDLISIHRENLQGLFDQNAISIMVRDRQCTPEEAVAEVRALRDRIMSLYLNLRDQVSATARPELRRYVHEIGYWIRGHIIWADFTTRYCAPVDPETGEEQDFGGYGLVWADEPADANPAPLPIPQIAWWWDQLEK